MVYFAQFNLNSDAIAMVTASHNENGWTGVKMGIKKGLTHAPEEMKELKEITLNQNFSKGKGNEKQINNFDKIYKDDLINKNKIEKKIKAVVACGNGTAGIFAPDILRGIGCEVIELDCNLDWNFPKYNPNPEDLEMLHEIAKVVKKNKINKKIKAIVACGNGTAGIFAPEILKGIGCEVIELDCNLDWSFPKYNPNPEDLEMLHAISKAVKENNADIGFGFDGDGDRVGIIDNIGDEIFSDKIGLLIACLLYTSPSPRD